MDHVTNYSQSNITYYGKIIDYDDLKALDELKKFNKIYEIAANVSDKIDNVLSVIGALGNLLALITMMKSRSMKTPSFVYHRILIAADFMFCINYIIVKIVHYTMASRTGIWVPPKFLYHNKAAVSYVSVLSRTLTSTFGYIVLYTSIAISVDRFVALIVSQYYDRFNRSFVAWTNIAVFIGLSAIVHSWSTWVEKRVVEIPLHFNNTNLFYYYVTEHQNSELKSWIHAKDIYNMIIRIAYPVLLTVLSAAVIYAYNVQQKRRRALCTINKRRLRRERCLFLLMIAVVILTYIQVLPREGKRILDFLYPSSELKKQMKNRDLPLPDRLTYFYILSYGHEFWRLVQNTCTVIDRSLLFYLYFILNYSFRREVVRVFRLNKLFCRRGISYNTSRRYKSNNQSGGRNQGLSPLIRNTVFNFTSMEYSGYTSAVL